MSLARSPLISRHELIAIWNRDHPDTPLDPLFLEAEQIEAQKIASPHSLTPYDPTVPIVCMWGLGNDSFNGILRLIRQLEQQGYPLSKIVVLCAMTGLEWSVSAGFLNECFFLPILARKQIRLLQIIKGGPSVRDRYTVLDDSRTPRKLWLYGRATPPLSPMSEQIAYDINGLYSPLHPLWSPDAVWDLTYRPENFGPPDPYVEHDHDPEVIQGNLIYNVARSHRHASCPLPTSLDSDCADFGENQQKPEAPMGTYYLEQGTLPQFRSTRRDCSLKFKGTLGESAIESTLEQTWSLGQNLLQVGGLPQFAAAGNVCSNQYKQEGSGQLIEDQFGEHSLGKDLLTGGVVPQASRGEGRGKCSNKSKSVPTNTWVDEASTQIMVKDDLNIDLAVISDDDLMHLEIATAETEWRTVGSGKDKIKLEFNVTDPNKAIALPPYVVVLIFFNNDAHEHNRRKRGEFSVSEKQKKRKQPRKPKVYRIMRYPLQEYGVGRKQLELENQIFCGEPMDRSACSICCFSGICGTDNEVFAKHSRMPIESGFACLIEYNARMLNSKQTTFPGSRGLIEMNQMQGNWENLLNLEDRLNALPWAIYRVQRLTGGTPYRNTEILSTGNHQTLQAQFPVICEQLGATLTCDPIDGITRGCIEYREEERLTLDKKNRWVPVKHTVQDLVVMCPALPIEKRRPGWKKAWEEAHLTRLEIVPLDQYHAPLPSKKSRSKAKSSSQLSLPKRP